MSIDDLKRVWDQQKDCEGDQLIPERDILRAIQIDLDSQTKVRRYVYNMSSVMFLLIFCQTC